MAFKVAQGSMFAVLSRSPWWYSVLVGCAFITISAVILSGQYVILGIFGALPFFGIAGYSRFKQSRLPSKQRVMEVSELARKMSASRIAETIAAPYVEQRFDSTVFKGSAADLELVRGNRTILLCTRRFKVANTGVEPLKQLVAAGEKIEATEHLYVALGEISAAARDYAQQHDIELIQADRLAAFLDGQATIE